MKILVVDDDPVNSKVISATLKRLGHETHSAADGNAAWEKLQKLPVSVVISDWVMPGLDGLEFCRKVRHEQSSDYIYFILISSLEHSEANLLKAMEAGVDDFLGKPLNMTELYVRLRVAERILGAASHIQRLQRRMLTICAYTKKIKVSESEWVPVDKFFHDVWGLDFSHGLCPEEIDKVVADFGRKKAEKAAAAKNAG